MITPEHMQEALQLAYVHALAGAAGLNVAPRRTFDYGVDGTFHSVKNFRGKLVDSGFPLDFQMKASTLWRFEGANVVYDLEAHTHRFLTDREKGQSMAILILLCLPPDHDSWLTGHEEHLLLRRCCYWFEPTPPPTSNASKVRIRVPRANVLDPPTLRGLMQVARNRMQGGSG